VLPGLMMDCEPLWFRQRPHSRVAGVLVASRTPAGAGVETGPADHVPVGPVSRGLDFPSGRLIRPRLSRDLSHTSRNRGDRTKHGNDHLSSDGWGEPFPLARPFLPVVHVHPLS
jgi:hypothetical protein